MALDGTFYVENEVPYVIYAHEWIQTLDGTMEAIRLAPDLAGLICHQAFPSPFAFARTTIGLAVTRESEDS